jgi:hypothetical protein
MSAADPDFPEGSILAGFQFCDLCGRWLKTGGSGMQNGVKHFSTKHSHYEVSSPIPSVMEIPVNSHPQSDINTIWKEVMFVARGLHPASVIKDPMFTQIKTTYQLWQILRSLKCAIEKKIASDLSRVTRLALVEDGWTDLSQRNYEGLWVHGMRDGTRVSFCIGQIPVQRGDSETLAPAIAGRLAELGLVMENNHEVTFLVADSASVNPRVALLFNQLTGNKCSFVPCAAHALNNMIQAIWLILRVRIQPLMLVIDTLRNNGAFNRYVSARHIQGNIGEPGETQGITRIATAFPVRWYSLTKMLTSAITLRRTICTYLREELTPAALKRFITEGAKESSVEILGVTQAREFTDSDIQRDFLIRDETASQPIQAESVVGISQEQWDYAEMARNIFGHFQAVMLSLEGDNFGTMSDIWRGFLWVRGQVQRIGHPDVTKGWVEAMKVWSRWEGKYPKVPTSEQKEEAIKRLGRDPFNEAPAIRNLSLPLYQIVSFLRPSNLPQIPVMLKSSEEWNYATACLKVIFDAVKHGVPEWVAEQALIAREQAQVPKTDPIEFSRVHLATTGMDPPTTPRLTEWDRYLNLRLQPSEDGKLEKWWQNHSSEFPAFYLISRMYLFVPGTSAGVERTFSVARRILTRLRMKMKPENAELLVFLHENIEILEAFQAAGECLW